MYIIEKIVGCAYAVKDTLSSIGRHSDPLSAGFCCIGRLTGTAIIFIAGLGIGYAAGAVFRRLMIGFGIW